MKGLFADAVLFLTHDSARVDCDELQAALVNAQQAGESVVGGLDEQLGVHGDRAGAAVRILSAVEDNSSGSLGGGRR